MGSELNSVWFKNRTTSVEKNQRHSRQHVAIFLTRHLLRRLESQLQLQLHRQRVRYLQGKKTANQTSLRGRSRRSLRRTSMRSNFRLRGPAISGSAHLLWMTLLLRDFRTWLRPPLAPLDCTFDLGSHLTGYRPQVLRQSYTDV